MTTIRVPPLTVRSRDRTGLVTTTPLYCSTPLTVMRDPVRIDVLEALGDRADVERRDRERERRIAGDPPAPADGPCRSTGRLSRRPCRRTPSVQRTPVAPPQAASEQARRDEQGAGSAGGADVCHEGSPPEVPVGSPARSMMRPVHRDDGASRATAQAGHAQRGPRSNQIRSPVNRSVTGSHGNRIRTSSETASPDGGDAGPRPQVGAGQRRDLERALRPDDDLGQGERVVRERREQLRVEGPGAVVALPALAGRDDLVDAVRRQRRDQPVDVAARPRRSSGGPTAA